MYVYSHAIIFKLDKSPFKSIFLRLDGNCITDCSSGRFISIFEYFISHVVMTSMKNDILFSTNSIFLCMSSVHFFR